MTVITKVKEGLDRVLKVLCVGLFALLVVLVTWQVFTRLVLNNPSIWTERLAMVVFIWMSLFGISIATGEKADVMITSLVEKLPVNGQRITEILAYLSILFFAVGGMIIGGRSLVIRTWAATDPVLPLTSGQVYLAVPLAGVLVTFYLIYHIIRTLSPQFTGIADAMAHPEEDEAMAIAESVSEEAVILAAAVADDADAAVAEAADADEATASDTTAADNNEEAAK